MQIKLVTTLHEKDLPRLPEGDGFQDHPPSDVRSTPNPMYPDDSPPTRSSSRRPGFLTLITNASHPTEGESSSDLPHHNARRHPGEAFGNWTTSLLLPPRNSEGSIPRSNTGPERPSYDRQRNGMSSKASQDRIFTPHSDMGRTTKPLLDPTTGYALSAQASRSEMDLRRPSDHHVRNASSLSINQSLRAEKETNQSHLRKKKGRLLNGLPLSRLFRTGWNVEEDVPAEHIDNKREEEKGKTETRPGGQRSHTTDVIFPPSTRSHDPIRTPTPLPIMPSAVLDDEDEVIIVAHKTSRLGRKGSIKDMLDRFKSGRSDKRRKVEGEDDGARWDMIDTADRAVDVPAEVTKDGYAEEQIVPRSSIQKELEEKKDLLCVPSSEGTEAKDKVKRKPSWRRGGKREKDKVVPEAETQGADEGIGQPMLVSHNLHVTASFKGLPPAWIEQLRQQGIGQKEMEMIMSGRRQKDSITSMNGVAQQESSEILTSAPLMISPPRIALQDIAFGGSPSHGLRVEPEWTPLKPPPRPRRQVSDQQISISKPLGASPIQRGRLIDRHLLRSPTEDKPARHLRASSENLLGSVLNGIQQGHKKSMSCLNNLQGSANRDADHIKQEQSPTLYHPEPKRPIRFRRRAGTEDSPLLLNLDKPTEASGSSSFPQLVYTPVRSQARSRLSTELREFGAIKLSFEMDRPGQSGSDDWADEVLMTFDRHRESLDSESREGLPRPSFESVANVPRSVSVETGSYQMYHPARMHRPPESQQCASTPSGTWGSDRSEMIQSPEELLPLGEPLFAASSFARYDDHDDRAREIGLSLPRTPTPPGFESKGKKLSISPPRRSSSMNRGASVRSFGRAPHDALHERKKASDDFPASLRYRTISLTPCGDMTSSVEEDTFLTPSPSEDHGALVRGAHNSAMSENLSYDGHLSTTEDHSLMSLGTVQTAWRATPVSFNVLGDPEDCHVAKVEQGNQYGKFLHASCRQ